MHPLAPPLETGIAPLLARCLPDDVRDTDHGRAVALWLGDVGNAAIDIAAGMRGAPRG